MGLDINVYKAKKRGLAEKLDKCAELNKKIDELYESMDNVLTTDAIKELQGQYDAVCKQLDECTDDNAKDALRKNMWNIREQISDAKNELRNTSDEYKELQSEAHDVQEEYDKVYPYVSLAYFRKVNFLMSFFEYEGNCEYKEISKDEVELLVENCKEVLNDHSKASELLPTQGGFFYGSTEYDEYYFDDVKEVLDEFTKILDNTEWDSENVYFYAWW